MDPTRYTAAARLIGLPVNAAIAFKDVRSMVAMRTPIHMGETPPTTTDNPDPKQPPDQNVFQAKYEGELDVGEIANQWDFVRKMLLKPSDLAIGIDELEDNQRHLLTNGWTVVLKETLHWHFRKTAESSPKPVETTAELREKQDTEYAIAQVTDFEREQEENKKQPCWMEAPALMSEHTKQQSSHLTNLKVEEPSLNPNEKLAAAVTTAIDISKRAYKRRLVTSLVMNRNMGYTSGHNFAEWVFESQDPCTTDEKQRFQEFWKSPGD